MIVEYGLTPSDYVAFLLYHNAHTATIQKSARSWRFGLPLVWIAIGLVPIALGKPFSAADLVFPAFAIVWIVGMPSFIRWSVRRTAARYYDRGIVNGQIGLHRVELTDTGIRDTTALTDGHVAWAAVDRVAEGDEHLFIYIGPHAAHVIPKAALGDRLDTFRDVIVQRSAKRPSV